MRHPGPAFQDNRAISAAIIISYDGTANDDDALALGALLAGADLTLALAYVRHSRELDPEREALAQHDAQSRLARGAALLGTPDIPSYVVFSASTGQGLEELADAEGASLIVFGSDYRTPPGDAEPPGSAQQLLEIGSVAIAVAAAGLRAQTGAQLERIAVLTPDDAAAVESAQALAARLGASVIDGAGEADLTVVGSQQGAPPGRVALSGLARTLLENSRGSVLVLPSGSPLRL